MTALLAEGGVALKRAVASAGHLVVSTPGVYEKGGGGGGGLMCYSLWSMHGELLPALCNMHRATCMESCFLPRALRALFHRIVDS